MQFCKDKTLMKSVFVCPVGWGGTLCGAPTITGPARTAPFHPRYNATARSSFCCSQEPCNCLLASRSWPTAYQPFFFTKPSIKRSAKAQICLPQPTPIPHRVDIEATVKLLPKTTQNCQRCPLSPPPCRTHLTCAPPPPILSSPAATHVTHHLSPITHIPLLHIAFYNSTSRSHSTCNAPLATWLALTAADLRQQTGGGDGWWYGGLRGPPHAVRRSRMRIDPRTRAQRKKTCARHVTATFCVQVEDTQFRLELTSSAASALL